jgi:hypothetical protein
LFIGACWTVVGNTIYAYPRNSLIGVGILLLGLPVYFFWAYRKMGSERTKREVREQG